MTTAPDLTVERERELLALEEEELALIEGNRAAFWNPGPIQYKFIHLVNDVMVKPASQEGAISVILLTGANSTSKTNTLANIIVNAMLKPQSEYFAELPWFRDLPRPVRIRAVCTAKGLEEGIIRELRRLLIDGGHMAEGYPKNGGKNYLSEWKTENDSFLDLLTWEQAVTQHAGATVDIVLTDEYGPKKIFQELFERLRFGGPFIWFMTPAQDEDSAGSATDLAWAYAMTQDAEEAKLEGIETETYTMNADAEDNCSTHSKLEVIVNGEKRILRGKIKHQTIVSRARRHANDRPTLMARLFGQFIQADSLSFKGYSRDRHMVKPYPIPSYWPLFLAYDYHPGHAGALMVVRTSPAGKVVVTHAKHLGGLYPAVSAEIWSIYRANAMPVVALIDPIAMTEDPLSGKSVFRELTTTWKLPFRSAGAEKAEKGLGCELIRQRLEGINGDPLIEIFDTCPEVGRQLARSVKDPKTGLPIKKDDDHIENLYRLVLVVPRETPAQLEARAAAMHNIGVQSTLVIPTEHGPYPPQQAAPGQVVSSLVIPDEEELHIG